ncbi:hypothetical protein AB0M39_08190 [Streptomyces sp. NPDC051907]|uniref:hypothetical protein n=1 Tax=Streptomyces sp. NPDC051907 TaxID=3155284 RepID=UPI0034314735
MTHSNLREPATGNTASGSAVKAGPEQAVPPTGGSGGTEQADLQQIGYYYDLRGQGVFERVLEADGLGGPYSPVSASITEFDPATGKAFMGDAVMTVHNVVPLEGELVHIRVDSGWFEDLSIRVYLQYIV